MEQRRSSTVIVYYSCYCYVFVFACPNSYLELELERPLTSKVESAREREPRCIMGTPLFYFLSFFMRVYCLCLWFRYIQVPGNYEAVGLTEIYSIQ